MGSSESKINRESDFYRWFTRNGIEDDDAEELYKHFAKIKIVTEAKLRAFSKDARFETFLVKNLTIDQAAQMRLAIECDEKRKETKNDTYDDDESLELNRWKDNSPSFEFSNMTRGNITRLNKKRPMIMGRFSKVWKYGAMDFHESIRLIYFSREEMDQLENNNKQVRPKLFVRVFTVELKYNTLTKRKILRIHGPIINRMQIYRYKCNEYICLENMCINDIVDIARSTMDTFGEYSYWNRKKNCHFFAYQLMKAIQAQNSTNKSQATKNVKNLKNFGIDCQMVQKYICEHFCENFNFHLQNNNDDRDDSRNNNDSGDRGDTDGDGDDCNVYEITHIHVGYDESDYNGGNGDTDGHDDDYNVYETNIDVGYDESDYNRGNGDTDGDTDGDDVDVVTHTPEEKEEKKEKKDGETCALYEIYKKQEGTKRKLIKSKVVSLIEIINDARLGLPNENNEIYSSMLDQERPILRLLYKETFAVLKKDGYLYMYENDKRDQLHQKLDLFRKNTPAELDEHDKSELQFRIGIYDVFRAKTPQQRNNWKTKINQLISASKRDLTVYQTISGQ